jgi:DNA-binding transcriptional LysR family regulator
LIGELRAERLDAVVVGLPAPATGLRATPAGHQNVVVALPVGHPLATAASISLTRLAPERLVVLPPDTNPAFHNAVVSISRDAGLSPAFVEVGEPRVEHVLLAVAAGAGIALLPDSAAERHLAPGIRYVPLDRDEPACETVVLTRRRSDDLATAGFLRAVAHAARPCAGVPAPQPPTMALAA